MKPHDNDSFKSHAFGNQSINGCEFGIDFFEDNIDIRHFGNCTVSYPVCFPEDKELIKKLQAEIYLMIGKMPIDSNLMPHIVSGIAHRLEATRPWVRPEYDWFASSTCMVWNSKYQCSSVEQKGLHDWISSCVLTSDDDSQFETSNY